jgi:peptidoglycan DL-endopeptidase CwlO
MAEGNLTAKLRAILVSICAGLALALGTEGFAEPTTRASKQIDEKRAEAEQVLEQIREIDSRLDKAVDAYNAAQLKLKGVESLHGLNRRHLRIVRANYKRAQKIIEQRLVELYTSGETGFVELLLGASSLSDFIDRVDAADRITEQDARVIGEIISFRNDIRKRAAVLRRQQAEQKRLLAERGTRIDYIESQLGERERLLVSIRDEITRLAAEERERQRRLAAQAHARLVAALAAEQQSEGSASAATESTVPQEVASAPSSVNPSSGAIPAPPPSRYGSVVGIALQYLGIPYRWGGASPESGFDCSGFLMYIYAKVGVALPHNAAMQYGYGVSVSREQLEPGDLVFFDGLGHNGMYIGDDQFVHAPHTGDVVKISSVSDPWYTAKWVGARRLL